jgi:hypothetical protein
MSCVRRTAYPEAALAILADSGTEGLTVSEPCTGLGVTEGSLSVR